MKSLTTQSRIFEVVAQEEKRGVVVPLGNAADANKQRQILMAEAAMLEAHHGANAYSDYLVAHHRRPGVAEATAIGRLLGGRVEADDGSLQPPLTKADQLALKDIKARRNAASRRYDQILRLQVAISALAANKDDPADLISGGSVLFESSEIRMELDYALSWLSRFAQEWHSREKETRA